MKKILLPLALILSLSKGFSQNIGINATGATPHSSAMLDVSSTTKGMLIPRMTSIQRTAISAPATGLMVYDTDNNNFWFYNSTSWAQVTGGNNGWSVSGNAGTNPSTNFIGTTDNVSLRFKVNNVFAGEISPLTNNMFFGLASGNTTGTGGFNTGVGINALQSLTTGVSNTATGYHSLSLNTSGYNNTAYGYETLATNTTGVNNTAIGWNSLSFNSTGFANTSLGSNALSANSTGIDNTAVGYGSLLANHIGSNNTASGFSALLSANADDNTADGYKTLYNNTSGNDNTAIGSQALYSNTTGLANTAVGFKTLYANTTGINNIAVGFGALFDNISGGLNLAIGVNALASNTSGGGNVALGHEAALFNTVGNYNTAIGYDALLNLDGGSKNIAIGYNSGTDPGSPGVNNTISIGNDGFLNAASNQVFLGNFSSVYYGSHVSWSTFSDARIKTNIKDEVKGLDFILRLHPVTYNKDIKAMVRLTGSKETPDFAGKYDVEKIKFSGFLAQEVEQAAITSGYDFSGIHKPQNSKDLYALSYESFVVPLVKAVQEQQKIIEEQSNEMKKMEQRLKAIEEKIK
jgi:trimeric autotransporter adhesin